MNARYGQCRNPLACSLADARLVLRLAEGEPFFCPECARPLTPAKAWGGGFGLRQIRVAAALLLIAGGAAGSLVLWPRPGAPPRKLAATPPAPRALAPKPAAIEAQPPIAVPPPPAVFGAAPVFPAQPPPAPTALRKPAMLPAVAKLAPAKAAAPTPVAPPSPPPGAAPPPPEDATVELLTAVRLKPAPLPATPQPLLQPAPSVAPAAPEQPPPAQANLAKPPAAAPPATAATGRVIVLPPGSKLSFGPLQGVNLPQMPSHLSFVNPDAARKPGSVQADCKIGLDGVPSDCRKVAEKGAAEVSDTILAWLGSGAIRYSPAEKNGHKIVERRILTVNFGGGAH
jgi:hypothetical protein